MDNNEAMALAQSLGLTEDEAREKIDSFTHEMEELSQAMPSVRVVQDKGVFYVQIPAEWFLDAAQLVMESFLLGDEVGPFKVAPMPESERLIRIHTTGSLVAYLLDKAEGNL